MRNLIGIVAVLLICVTASVSFAADGAEIAKEQIIYIDVGTPSVDIELNVIGELEYSRQHDVVSDIIVVTDLESNEIITTEHNTETDKLHVDPGRIFYSENKYDLLFQEAKEEFKKTHIDPGWNVNTLNSCYAKLLRTVTSLKFKDKANC